MKVQLKECFKCKAPRIIWKQFEGQRCCRECWNKIKPTIALKQKPLRKSQKPIAKQSPRRKKENALYSAMRKVYLAQHPKCEMAIPGVCSGEPSCEIHHQFSGKDREKYFLVTTTWKATERKCHDFCHVFPIEAREMGFLK